MLPCSRQNTGTFEDYAFGLNGRVIKQHALINSPGARLNNVFSYAFKLEGHNYGAAVYFHTEERYAPPVGYTDDPAYFIKGQQASSYDLCLSEAESYHRTEKSARDTTINGRSYRSYVHVHTDEDFFADTMTMPKTIKKYTDLPIPV